ncbi:MAG: tryptophan synthase subunit alpha [Deltaproteobacteria bacterium]|nr:tryptophan synthase subunit alpha [Deltaproteobacteria bacterium]
MNKQSAGNRLKDTFDDLKRRGKKGLITFVTAGDPSIKETEKIVLELSKSGADIIELGIPFSDPMADGPTIQASSERALKKHVNVASVLKLIANLRKKTEVPIVLFGYYNPVFSYGLKKFARDAKKAGADGVLIVDLPPEESLDLKGELNGHGLDLIYLLTPTSDKSRIRMINKLASGFIYYVSLTGVTGARVGLPRGVEASIRNIKKQIKLPLAVGFGISNAANARDVARHADAVVVGSAIINTIDTARKTKTSITSKVGTFVRSLKKGTNAA